GGPARTALPVPLRSSRPRDRLPDSLELGLVLDAVKAWPGSAGACRSPTATTSLDRISTRGPAQSLGRDEETGFQIEQRNWPGAADSSPLMSTCRSGTVVPLSSGAQTQKRTFDVLPKPDKSKSYRHSRPCRPGAVSSSRECVGEQLKSG